MFPLPFSHGYLLVGKITSSTVISELNECILPAFPWVRVARKAGRCWLEPLTFRRQPPL